MRKIDLRSYPVTIGEHTKEYDVRGSLITVMFSVPGMPPTELLQIDDLARKVRDCVGEDLLLEEAEYSKIQRGLNAMKTLGQFEVELVRRILHAPDVKVQEKPEPLRDVTTSLTGG